jgi:hypothetical protein
MAVMLVLLMESNYEVNCLDGFRWHDIHILSFMKIDTGIEGILRFCLSNLKFCNVGVTGGSDL